MFFYFNHLLSTFYIPCSHFLCQTPSHCISAALTFLSALRTSETHSSLKAFVLAVPCHKHDYLSLFHECLLLIHHFLTQSLQRSSLTILFTVIHLISQPFFTTLCYLFSYSICFYQDLYLPCLSSMSAHPEQKNSQVHGFLSVYSTITSSIPILFARRMLYTLFFNNTFYTLC